MSEFSEFARHNPINPQDFNAQGVAMVEYGPGERNLIVAFYPKAKRNEAKSKAEGKPVFDTVDFVKIQHPGEKLNIVDREATEIDKRRFSNHWNAYCQGRAQIPDGVPLNLLFPNHPHIEATLKQYNVHTVEQLANLSGNAIGTVGMGAQDWVNKAKKYLEQAEKGVNHHQMQKLLDERDNKIAQLQRQIDEMAAQFAQAVAAQTNQPVPVTRNPVPHRMNTLPDLSQSDPQSMMIAGTMNEQNAPRRAGRPKGSKNKPKEN